MNNIKRVFPTSGYPIFRVKVFFMLCILSTLNATSQNTVSPYSVFGLGEIQNRGFGKIQAMGGAGIAYRPNNSLNNVNPASYTGLDSLRIITEFGLQGKLYDISSSTESQSGFTGNLNYVALGFRYNDRMGGSFGIVPFSSVGYSVITDNYVEGTNAPYSIQYTGSGGITQFYFSNAIKIGDHFSLGITASYLFGPIIQDELTIATEDVSSFQISRRDYLKSFYFDYGMQYAFKLKKTDIVLGTIFSNSQNLTSTHYLELYDAATSSLLQGERYDTDYLTLPNTLGAGIGISNKKNYEILFDYHFQQWSDITYKTQYNKFDDSHRFSLGTEFKPWEARPSNVFYKNWVYRAGANYQKSYLKIDGSAIIDKSVSLGIGVPLTRNISAFDFGVVLGTNGTTANHMIREKYILFQIGFSLNEYAFIRKTFN